MAIISSGKFTSLGLDVNLSIRSDVDWISVYNYTEMAAAANVIVQSYWQRGMDAGTGISYSATGGLASLIAGVYASGGFTLFDTSLAAIGNPVATTSSTNAVRPVVATASTAGLVTGTVVRLSGIAAAPTICGIDFEIDTIVANTSFRVRWPLDNAPGAVGGAGFYRVVARDPMFLPGRRFIVDIDSVGATTVVTTSVRHGYEIGEVVRMYVPSAANGMVQINNLQGIITAVDLTNNTFTLDIDSSSFTPFAWPVAADSPYTPAQCMAFGSAAAGNITQLEDATRNIAEIGITLTGGVNHPAGAANDVIYWVAGKSDQVTNE